MSVNGSLPSEAESSVTIFTLSRIVQLMCFTQRKEWTSGISAGDFYCEIRHLRFDTNAANKRNTTINIGHAIQIDF